MVLLGDACHPMTPYMAQGAATAMEDAVVLSRCIEAHAGRHPGARSRASRRRAASAPRASRAPRSRTPSCGSATDPGWVYGYDAWTAPLDRFEEMPALEAAQ